MNNKRTKKAILDSVKKNVISLEKNKMNKQKTNNIENNNQKEIKLEFKNNNPILSFKKSPEYEKMNISQEDEFVNNKSKEDSLNNIDNSYGENVSTANTTFENDKIKLKQSINGEKNEFTININEKPKNEKEMETKKESEREIISNPQHVDEYIGDILENLIQEEKNMANLINPNYFEFQKEINQSMRSILIDWLIEVHDKLNFKQETLYITIYMIDSYLSKKRIEKRRFQLLGITALLIATKLNEIYFRKIGDYVLLTDNAYTIDDILEMEEEIAKTLSFNFLVPSPLSFFEIFSRITGISEDKDKCNLGEFLLQSFLLDFRSFNYSYSIIACASCFIVMKLYKLNNYKICHGNKFYFIKDNNIYETKANSIIECANNICEVISEMLNSNLQSIIQKYAQYNCYDIIKKFLVVEKK